MNKSELIELVAKDAGISKTDARKAIEAIIYNLSQPLKEGKKVSLVGFGTFYVSKREARKGRNPQTGETIKIPAKNVVKFKPSSKLTDTDDTGPLSR